MLEKDGKADLEWRVTLWSNIEIFAWKCIKCGRVLTTQRWAQAHMKKRKYIPCVLDGQIGFQDLEGKKVRCAKFDGSKWACGWVLARKGRIVSWSGRYHNAEELRGSFYRRPPEGAEEAT